MTLNYGKGLEKVGEFSIRPSTHYDAQNYPKLAHDLRVDFYGYVFSDICITLPLLSTAIIFSQWLCCFELGVTLMINTHNLMLSLICVCIAGERNTSIYINILTHPIPHSSIDWGECEVEGREAGGLQNCHLIQEEKACTKWKVTIRAWEYTVASPGTRNVILYSHHPIFLYLNVLLFICDFTTLRSPLFHTDVI